MAVTKTIHRSFAGGEVSPQMFGRIDDTKFQAGLETCLNFLCLPQGPIERRPGFAYVREVKDSTKSVRLIPFVFNNSQTMVIELGDKYARFHTQGATLLNESGEPYEIETPWEEIDLPDIHYVQSADVMTIVHPRHAPSELKRYSLTDWRIEQIQFGPKLATPSNVNATRKTKAAEDQNADKYTFKYKVSALNHDKTEESRPSGAVSVVANLYAYGTTAEITCDTVAGASYYRFYKNQGGVYGYIGDSDTPSIIDDNIAPSMDITPRNYDDVFSAAGGIVAATITNQGSGYVGKRDVVDYERTGTYYDWDMNKLEGSRTVTIPSMFEDSRIQRYSAKIVDRGGNGSGATVKLNYTVTETVQGLPSKVRLDGFTITNGGSNYADPWIEVWYSGNYTHKDYEFKCKVSDASGTVTLNVMDESGYGAVLEPTISNGKLIGVNIVNPGANYKNPTVSVVSAQGSGAAVELTVGEAGNYPSAVGYFEQRRCFAGLTNDPQRVIMTRSSTESDMSYSLPVQDDDRISVQISARELNQIRHIIPLSQLLLLTSGSEMRVSPLNSDAITPTSFSVRPQSYVGASNVQPCIVNTTVVYPASRGGHVLELGYNYQAGGYISGDLCLRSAHLFDYKTIKDMAFSKSPMPVLWFVSSDGGLLGLTYIPEQQIGSWHRHTTDGVFESVTSVSEGDEDHLYAVIKREINGKVVRYIERMSDRKFGDINNAFFVDCGGTYQGKPITKLSGLDWLEGKEVHILGDGSVRPPQVVTNGSIELDAEASVVHVGLPYTSDAKTLPAILQADDFGMGRQKNVSKVTVRTYQSSGIFAGPEFDDLVEYKQRTTESPGLPPSLVSGDIQLRVFTKWSDGGAICIRQADPLPLTLLSAVLEISV